MRRFTVKRSGDADAVGLQTEESLLSIVDPRERIRIAFEELCAIETKADIEVAKARGVAFSHAGFRERVRVGTTTLHITNKDLFDKVKLRLNELERIAGRPLRGQAAKGSGAQKQKRDAAGGTARHSATTAEVKKLEDEIRRLKELLTKSQQDILDLTKRLSAALQFSSRQ
ncbi:MAG: hypothetical protein ABS40_18515 [Agrobacterium sp. SCN 61-19]|nr:MAG: hypothetical protein ABS40_18515 [Agrobacterium sp. SCN 61-19]